MEATRSRFGVTLPLELVRRVDKYVDGKNKVYGYRKYTQTDFTIAAFELFLEAEDKAKEKP